MSFMLMANAFNLEQMVEHCEAVLVVCVAL